MMDRKWIYGLPAIAAGLCLNLVVFPLTLPRPAVAKDLVPPRQCFRDCRPRRSAHRARPLRGYPRRLP
jgi:hypothetical protein